MERKVKYDVIFLEPVKGFLDELDNSSRKKVLYNIWKWKVTNDQGLFKKLTSEIWEFRSNFEGKQYRLLAFWAKTEPTSVPVIITNGFIKKSRRIPKREISKAEKLRRIYIENQ